MNNKLAKLNKEVRAAISKAEKAERKVSHLQEEITKLTHPYSAEGRIARRGAVRAAVAIGDKERAKNLVKHFLAEDGIDEQSKYELITSIV